MALNFPSSPTLGQEYGNWVWNGSTWGVSQTMPGGIPAGSIMQWAGATAPDNWLICDGAAISRTTYASLFSAIGTTYGAGNGTSTFNLPDLRGRIPVGKNGGSFGTLGATGGAETVTLTEAQIPSHTHVQNAHTHVQDAHNHTHRQWIFNGASASGYHYGFGYSTGGNANDTGAATGSGEVQYGNFATTATNQNTTATNQNTGGGQAHTNLQPYQVVNYIIKYTAASTPADSEFADRITTAEATVTGYNTRLTTVEGASASQGTRLTSAENYISTVKAGYSSRNIYVQVDTTNRSSGTSWTLGPTFPTLSYSANSKIKMSYHAPMRNDSGSWGGIYIEPQIQFNGGTWQSLGSTGHDMMTLSGADIATYHNEILVAPGITSNFTAAFRFYFRAYDSTVYFNNGSNHDINVTSGTATIMSGDNGNQHYFHIIVEEFATN